MTGVGLIIDGHQRIGLWKIGGQALPGDAVRDQTKIFHHPGFALIVRDQIHPFAFLKFSRLPVERVDENHFSPVEDSAIAVIWSVDGGVVLVMTSNRHQKKLVGGKVEGGHGVDGELGLSAHRGEGPLIPNRMGKVKPSRLLDSLIKIFKSGNDP